MIMRRTAFIQLCLYLTIGAVVAAFVVKFSRAGGMDPGARGDMLVLGSPLFFVIAAKNARRFERTSVVLAAVGVLLAGGALWAALQSGKV